jgi:basic membrane lipoprotein Med (substrate-binding protein (PBP1-ABC) superfamily)
MCQSTLRLLSSVVVLCFGIALPACGDDDDNGGNAASGEAVKVSMLNSGSKSDSSWTQPQSRS